jgi:hypothetical protein
MPISIIDQKNRIEECLFGNVLINMFFGNIIIISILIVLFNIAVLYLGQNEDSGIIKLFIWMSTGTLLFLILHNKTIKLEYKEQLKVKGSEEFKGMMENNTLDLIGRNETSYINGKNELIEKDIIKFLD